MFLGLVVHARDRVDAASRADVGARPGVRAADAPAPATTAPALQRRRRRDSARRQRRSTPARYRSRPASPRRAAPTTTTAIAVADHDAVPGFLLLEDGTLFRGTLASRSRATTVAEVVFTTNMSGLPGSLHRSVVPRTDRRDDRADDRQLRHQSRTIRNPARRRSLASSCASCRRRYSNWRATGDLASWLEAAQVPILEEVDTRRLTRHLRSVGVMRGVIGAGETPDARSAGRARRVPDRWKGSTSRRASRRASATSGAIRRRRITSSRTTSASSATSCGCSTSTAAASRSCPPTTPAEAVLELNPDGVFLSNGPGDPAAVDVRAGNDPRDRRARTCRCSASAWGISS